MIEAGIEFVSVQEIAESWQISERRVRMLCAEGKISGARQDDGRWLVHAPYRTVLEGRVENGKIVRLEVTPSERSKDVVMD